MVDLQGLPLITIVVPANMNDSTLYIPTLKNFNIKRHIGRLVNRSSKVTADGCMTQLKLENIKEKRNKVQYTSK